MGYFVDDALWLERVSATLLSLFALVALVLALIGIYGVLAEAGVMIAIGLVLGLGFAIVAVKPLVATQLHEVSATDPATLAIVAVLLAVIALAGCLGPAWRASRTNPNEVLRGE